MRPVSDDFSTSGCGYDDFTFCLFFGGRVYAELRFSVVFQKQVRPTQRRDLIQVKFTVD